MDFHILKDVLPKTVQKWNQEDVFVWLKLISLTDLFQPFELNHIDGKKLLKLSDRHLLSELNIKSGIKRKKLLAWIQSGLPKYSQFLKANNLNSEDSSSSRQSIFCNKMYSNEQIESTGEAEQLNSQGKVKLDEQIAGENLSQTHKNSLFRKQKQQDLKKSVKKPKNQTTKRELLITDGQKISRQCFSFINRGGTIGRCSTNEIFVIDSEVQLIHCAIEFQNSDFFLEPFNSKCSLWFKIKQKMTITEDFTTEIGNQTLKISLNSDKSIVILKKCTQHQKVEPLFTLTGQEGKMFKIGRNRSNDAVFSLDSSISGYHAKLYFSNNSWIFEDLNSTNGVWIEFTNKKKIQDGDVFKMGKNVHTYMCKTKTNDRFDDQIKKQDSLKCMKCRQNVRNCYNLPCFHSCICSACFENEDKCLLCQVKIIETVKFFTV